MWNDWTLAGVVGVLIAGLDVVAIFRAISRESGFERTLVWIFAILAFPLLGALGYFLLASPSVGRTTARMRAHKGGPDAEGSPPEPAPGSLAHLAESLTGLPPTTGNDVQLLVADQEAFQRIEDALEKAERSIWAEYFLVANDVTGRRFLDLLTRKAKEGLEVRLLYDAIGSFSIPKARLEQLSAAGGRSECFLPLNPLRRRWSVNLRNHRKLIVVDGKVGFTGGMNVGDEYSGRARRKGDRHFMDSHTSLRGPAVDHLARVFAEDWAFATDEALPVVSQSEPCGPSEVSIVPSGPHQRLNANGLLYFSAIAGAEHRVWLTNPYFVPDEPLLVALESASLRGVDVRLLLPANCDVAVVRRTARSYYERLLRAGVRIFEYLPSMLHAKRLLVDDEWSLVGSANADIRSFYWNFELGALVRDPQLAEHLAQRFLKDTEDSREMQLEAVLAWGRGQRLLNSLSRLLSPLL